MPKPTPKRPEIYWPGYADAWRPELQRRDLAPAATAMREQVAAIRYVAGRLLADEDAATARVGRVLADWVRDGGDLVAALGLRPPQGSHLTPQEIFRLEQRDRALLKLSAICRGDRAAFRVLQGFRKCPASAVEVVAEIRLLGAPGSVAAFGRARYSRLIA